MIASSFLCCATTAILHDYWVRSTYSLHCLLVASVLIDMHHNLLGLIGARLPLELLSFNKLMDGIDLLVLFFYCLDECFSLLFILEHIFLMLVDTLFIVLNSAPIFLFEQLNFPQQVSNFLLELTVLLLKFLITEVGWLDVFGDYFFYLHQFLYYLLHLYWPVNIDWLYSHLLPHPTGYF